MTFNISLTSLSRDARTFSEQMLELGSSCLFLTVNAYNSWALIDSGDTTVMAFGSPDRVEWLHDDIVLLGSRTGLEMGIALLALGFLIGRYVPVRFVAFATIGALAGVSIRGDVAADKVGF